ncbi:hypothetical protein QWY14_05285 [Planococcus sp. N028]|uniref:Uncharacterized protein n=1 Tax=Planococcus shixiaomingii TaxID=3058393 RepID=A0ABT8N0I1_9BACL|nr:hypothetical protein [Planococcus sp. N028]MDN7241192.1 hypothetical protein [Planococcus sp. N028]
MGLNFIAAYFFQVNIIDIAFPVGILGIIVTSPNNPMTDLFNSQTYMPVEGERYSKFGQMPIFASIAYTFFGAALVFFVYKDYFI